MDSPSVVTPNATAQQRGNPTDVFVADQIGRIKNQGSLQLTRPVERGIVVNWPCQASIWHRVLPQALGLTDGGGGDDDEGGEEEEEGDEDGSSTQNPSGGSPAKKKKRVAKKATKRGAARSVGQSSASGSSLLVTCAPFTPDSLTEQLDQVVFEEFGFAALTRLPAPAASACLYHHESAAAGATTGALCCVVVDVGYSATYVVPSLRGRAVQGAVRRLNVGGRLLTRAMQEALSYRQYNMMDESVLVTEAMEALCYLSPDSLEAETKRSVGLAVPATKSAYREWVLPDFTSSGSSQGAVRQLEVDAARGGRWRRTRKTDQSAAQCLRFESERFAVPELLFRPSDIGLQQGGVHEVVAEAVGACDPALQPLLFGNILLTGGCAALPNFKERLLRELRPLVPAHCPLEVTLAPPAASNGGQQGAGDPSGYAWRAAAHLAREHDCGRPLVSASGGDGGLAGPALRGRSVTKAEYEERGPDHCTETFRHW